MTRAVRATTNIAGKVAVNVSADGPGVLLTRSDPAVAVVSLNNPRRRNAVSRDMLRQLKDVFAGLREEAEVRVVVLKGEGDHFCAGADISEFSEVRDTAEKGLQYEREFDATTRALMELPKPTFAAIEGYCLGGGCALAMACDFRVGSASARFGIPASRLGTLYGLLDLQNLVALVGVAHAKRIMYGGDQFSAEEAHRMGFLDVLTGGPVGGAVNDFAATLVARAPLTIAGSKLALNAIARGELADKRSAIEAATEEAMESEDYREGVRAFMEKRDPVFRGK